MPNCSQVCSLYLVSDPSCRHLQAKNRKIAISRQKFWNVQKFISKVSRLVTTKLLSTHAWQMARHGASCSASSCRRDRLRATKMAGLGTPYCGPLLGQNSCSRRCSLRVWGRTSIEECLRWRRILIVLSHTTNCTWSGDVMMACVRGL